MAFCLSTDRDSCVYIPRAFQLRTSDFTVEAWVKPQGGGSIITNKMDGGGDPYRGGFIFSISNDGRLHLILDNGFAFQSVDSAATLDLFDGNWHHVAGVRHNFQLFTYLDGDLIPNQAHGNGDPSSMDLQTANGAYIAQGTGGLTTEVRLWWGAHDRDAIRSLMTQRLTGTETNLMCDWPFSVPTTIEPRHQFNGEPRGNVTFVPSTCPIDQP